MAIASPAWASKLLRSGETIPVTAAQNSACLHFLHHGKSHVYPHLSSGFERATRVAKGFHSDFRGPFSVPTARGELYLISIIDDYSRRIFGFLVKSQTEWFELWQRFVVRIEAEIGKSNCISWLISDNGGVYTAKEMKEFCSRGIQQKFAAPYAQTLKGISHLQCESNSL